MRVYYFGCWNSLGHHLYNHVGRLLHPFKNALPWKQIDGTLCPADTKQQGIVKIHYKNGWSAAAFWDYSVDHRPGSNSVLFVEDLIDITQVRGEFQETFPQIYNRFAFDLIEWFEPEERGLNKPPST